jgi:glycosyltransferase involved in cell wall biosynthesis
VARIVFFARTTRATLDDTEYYKQDIDALQALGHDVVVCTRYAEIPLRFDAIFVWWWTYALWPVLLSRLRGKPCLVTGVFNLSLPRTFAGRDFHRRPAWQRWLIAAAARWASANLFLNERELAGCREEFGLDNARYFPCIVHDDYLRGPGPGRKLALFNVAWAGRSNLVRKGIPELLQAVRLLKDEGCSVPLHLAGHDGDGTAGLIAEIERLGIGDEVTWHGALSRADKIEMLRACEVYVQPSHYEGFGLATAEAMGCGASIITCDVGATRAVVGECAEYCRPGDPVDLARAIKRVATDEALRRSLQRQAHERARREFAAAGKIERLRACLSEVGIG